MTNALNSIGMTKEQLGQRLRAGWGLREALLLPISSSNSQLRRFGRLTSDMLRSTDERDSHEI